MKISRSFGQFVVAPLLVVTSVLVLSGSASAQGHGRRLRHTTGTSNGDAAAVHNVDAYLMSQVPRYECRFTPGTDRLEPGCDQKLSQLADVLVNAIRKLDSAGVKNYRFEISGHTDSSGDAAKNKKLSKMQAEAIMAEMVSRGIPPERVFAIGYGSERPLVKPDNTPAKKAKNRRYEIRMSQ